MKRIGVGLLIFLEVIFLCSCLSTTEINEDMISNDISLTRETSKNIASSFHEEFLEEKIISQNQYYKLFYIDGSYVYMLYDEDGKIVCEGNNFREPHISLLDDQLLKFTLQTGTGLSTQWGYYYDVKRDVFSRKFNCIYDECNSLVAYGDLKKIIVRNIFDKRKYYFVLDSFNKSLADVPEPILDAKFVDNGTGLYVTYLSGENQAIVNEVVKIDKTQ